MFGNLKEKKLLILAGASVHCKVVQSAKEMGVHTIVTDYLRYEDSPAKQIADEYWDLNITQVDEIVEKCRKEKVDGVLNFCIDPAQRPYQEICAKLGFHCYGDKEQFSILTDKVLFKEFCKKHEIDVIEEYTIDQVENDMAMYPLFVKPNDSRGSRGQSVCYSKEDVREAVKNALEESSDGKYIIEQYMYGKQDFTMTYLVKDDQPYLVRIGDRYLGLEEDKLNKQCTCLVCPSKFTDLYYNKVHSKVCNFIKELGIKNGPVFMQGFVDEDIIRFYDPGLRFPGGEYESLLKLATGADIMKMLIEFALTGRMEQYNCLTNELYKLNDCHAVQLPITTKPGKIKKIEGLDIIKNNKNVISVFKRYEEGDSVPPTGDVRQRVCEIASVLDKNDSVKDFVSWIQNIISVKNEKDENMLTSLVSPSILNY